jgi:hypothetical protein
LKIDIAQALEVGAQLGHLGLEAIGLRLALGELAARRLAGLLGAGDRRPGRDEPLERRLCRTRPRGLRMRPEAWYRTRRESALRAR